MDGDIAPLSDIIKLAKEFDAFTFLDDAHETGVFGKLEEELKNISELRVKLM